MAPHHNANSTHYRMKAERPLRSADMWTIVPMYLMAKPNSKSR